MKQCRAFIVDKPWVATIVARIDRLLANRDMDVTIEHRKKAVKAKAAFDEEAVLTTLNDRSRVCRPCYVSTKTISEQSNPLGECQIVDCQSTVSRHVECTAKRPPSSRDVHAGR